MSSRTLLVDNYDSFTYNLFTLLTEVNGVVPTVVRNDADWDSLDLASYDNVVISQVPAGRIATVISESAAVSSKKRLSHFSVSVSATRPVRVVRRGRGGCARPDARPDFADRSRRFGHFCRTSVAVPSCSLPLVDRRESAERLRSYRVDVRRSAHGCPAPDQADVGSSVPSGVHQHRVRHRFARELPRSVRRTHSGSVIRPEPVPQTPDLRPAINYDVET